MGLEGFGHQINEELNQGWLLGLKAQHFRGCWCHGHSILSILHSDPSKGDPFHS